MLAPAHVVTGTGQGAVPQEWQVLHWGARCSPLSPPQPTLCLCASGPGRTELATRGLEFGMSRNEKG